MFGGLQQISCIFARANEKQMKQRLKFYLAGLLFVLCNTMVTGTYSPTPKPDKKPEFTFISQQQANRQAVYYLFYIYSHTPKEALAAGDTQIPHLKNSFRSSLHTNDLRNASQTSFVPDNHTHTYFHPDPVGYYVFALKKIVI